VGEAFSGIGGRRGGTVSSGPSMDARGRGGQEKGTGAERKGKKKTPPRLLFHQKMVGLPQAGDHLHSHNA
jgi:hypothetical protein